MESRPNWRVLAGSLQTLSTILAGFSFTLLVLALSKDILSSPIGIPLIGDSRSFALVLLALSGVVLIISTECLLNSQSYDVWSVPSDRQGFLQARANTFKVPFDRWREIKDKKVQSWYNAGVYLYYAGILIFLLGGAFLVYPYSIIASIGVFVAGFAIELGWMIFLLAE